MRLLMCTLAAIVAVPIFVFAAENDQLPLVYENNFESGMGDFAFTDSKAWNIIEEDGNHALALVSSSNYEPPFRSPLSIAGIKGLALSDFVLEADIKQTGRAYGHRDFCVFFGYEGPANFYYAHLATKADEHANSIFVVNNAPRLSIAKERSEGTDWSTGYHKIRVTRDAESGLIEVFFDDMAKPVMRTVDKTFPVGAVGFGSFDDTGQVDNIKIWGKKSSAEGSESK